MKTIFKLAMLTMLLISFSCSKEAMTDPASENLEALSLKGKKHRKGKKKLVTRRSLNANVAIGNDFSGFWLPAIGQYTGSSTITFFEDNPAVDGTLTQKSDTWSLAVTGINFLPAVLFRLCHLRQLKAPTQVHLKFRAAQGN